MENFTEPEIETIQNAVNEPIAEYGHEYTYADYLKFQFEEMVELIRGKIYKMSPAPQTKHQIISTRLGGEIYAFLKGKKCQVFDAPFDVVLPIANKRKKTATTVVQPDICVICDPKIIDELGCFGVPNLIIEILSASTEPKDRGIKYEVYKEAGINEYWIVSPNNETIEVYLLEFGKYSLKHILGKNDKITPFSLPEIEIDLSEIFY